MLLSILSGIALVLVAALAVVSAHAAVLRAERDNYRDLSTDAHEALIDLQKLTQNRGLFMQRQGRKIRALEAEIAELHATALPQYKPAADVADEKLADLNTAMAALKPGQPRGAGGRFMKVAK